MSRVNHKTPNLDEWQQPQPLADSKNSCTRLCLVKANGTPPALSASDRVLNPPRTLLRPPPEDAHHGSFQDGVPMSCGASPPDALLHGERFAGDTVEESIS